MACAIDACLGAPLALHQAHHASILAMQPAKQERVKDNSSTSIRRIPFCMALAASARRKPRAIWPPHNHQAQQRESRRRQSAERSQWRRKASGACPPVGAHVRVHGHQAFHQRRVDGLQGGDAVGLHQQGGAARPQSSALKHSHSQVGPEFWVGQIEKLWLLALHQAGGGLMAAAREGAAANVTQARRRRRHSSSAPASCLAVRMAFVAASPPGPPPITATSRSRGCMQ